jgi:hypothetical protein
VGKGLFDTVLINNNLQIPAPLLQKYAAEGAVPVQPDVWRLQKMGVRVVACDLLSQEELVRHDPKKLATAIFTEIL